MCLAIPAKIISLVEYSAKVDILGVISEVNVLLIERPEVGDYVLVHAGCAIQRIDTSYFKELEQFFQSMLEVQQNEE